MNDFLSSPFSPAMPMGNTSLAAGENTSLTLDKRESLLKSKFLRHRLKISALQETVSLLNMCLGEENQGRLKTDKELKILGKDLKKQMKENKSLSLKDLNSLKTWKTLRNKHQGCKNVLQKMGLYKKSFVITT